MPVDPLRAALYRQTTWIHRLLTVEGGQQTTDPEYLGGSTNPQCQLTYYTPDGYAVEVTVKVARR